MTYRPVLWHLLLGLLLWALIAFAFVACSGNKPIGFRAGLLPLCASPKTGPAVRPQDKALQHFT